MKDSRILVTGHKGFIGSLICKKLEEEGRIHEGYDAKDVSISELPSSIFQALTSFQPTLIFHVGANSDTLDQRVNEVMVQNFLTTDIVSEWAWANGAKLIYSSSAASYGTNGDHPSNLYGWSKYTAERAVLARGGIGLRYFNVYGPGEQNKARMASFAFQACMKFAEGEDVRLFPGEPKRDFVHVSDVVTANLFAAERYDEFSGQRFDVGTGVASSFESVLTTLGIPWGYYEETDIPKGYQSFTRAKPENFMPGWGPRVFIEDGMSRYRSQLDGDLG